MRTLDEQSARSFTRWGRFRRDARLLGRLAAMVFYYFTAGARMRRRYRRKEKRGEIYWLDES